MLRQRVLTAAIVLVIVVAAVLLGPLSWQVLIYVGCLLCINEFGKITGQRTFDVPTLWAYLIVTVIVWWPNWFHLFVFQALVGITFIIPVITRNRVTIVHSAAIAVGALYVGFGGESLIDIRLWDNGLAWLFLTMGSIWATDTAAYFAGSYFKGPKLWPEISPKKTISGALGGVVAGGLAACLVGAIGISTTDLWKYFVMGCLVSIAGQMGDLVESAYKRSAGVKDSGTLLPGHGGVLDRVDSLLFAAPLAMFLIGHLW